MKRIGKNETTEMAPVKKCFVGLETALYLLCWRWMLFPPAATG